MPETNPSPHGPMRPRRRPYKGETLFPMSDTGASKLLAGVDFNRRPDPLRELPQLVEHVPLLRLPGVQL